MSFPTALGSVGPKAAFFLRDTGNEPQDPLMKIIVAIKQVAVRDSQLRIAASGQWIDEADLAYEINEPDAYALEAGLQLKEAQGGEVVALSAGPPRVAQTIREALAKGADRSE